VIGSEEAGDLIRIGRLTVKKAFEGKAYDPPKNLKEKFKDPCGVFVTIHTYPQKELRGCVGIPYPVLPLWKAVVQASLSSAFRDPRFQPLRREELERVTFELSLLTPPKEIAREQAPERITVGKHGLIVERQGIKGLLLPQVAERYGWTPEEFLENTCLKAGLPPDCWQREGTKIYTFEAEIFEEVEPWGKVLKS
jgi:uncharacterized protein (TIGR00296 family)